MQPFAASCLWSPQWSRAKRFSLSTLIQLRQPHPVPEAGGEASQSEHIWAFTTYYEFMWNAQC